MGDCKNCSKSGAGCSGCAESGTLLLTPMEADFLQLLGQVAFLPVARKMGDLDPVYLEDDAYPAEEYSLMLQTLEKKGLISLDYSIPLKGNWKDAYKAYPIRGSMALTQRGQQVLDLLEYQGAQEE